MALTNDEKKEILELRGRQYSQRKIADKTGHSETTIRSVINEAERQVTRLRAEGLDAEQIAKELGHPLAFVRNTIDNWESTRGKAPEVDREATEPPKSADVKVLWDEFKRLQDIESIKESLRQQVQRQRSALQQLERQLSGEGIANADWHQRKQRLENALTDFALQQVDNGDSQKSLSDLQSVLEEIENQVRSLTKEYTTKVREAKELRRRQEKAHSDQLLSQNIDIPLFPSFVRKQIKRMVLVRTDEQASIVGDAMTQFALLMIKMGKESLEREQTIWRAFIESVEEGGWDYLRRQATRYQKDTQKMLVSIGVCPHCDVKLIREHAPGKEILRCPSCGMSYSISSERER